MSSPYRAAAIREIREEARDTWTIVLEEPLPAQAGQFVMVWVPGLDEKPFCVADDAPLTVCVRRVGPLSQVLTGMRPGDRMHYRGPFGRGYTLEGRRILLVGGGYGSAPLGLLCRGSRAAGVHATLVVGARTAADLLVTPCARAYAEEIHLVTEDGSRGERGLVTHLADRLLGEGSYEAVYGCGPNAMLDAVRALARTHGLPAQLSYEEYMRCGLGICGSCERDGLLLCRDGPVLRTAATHGARPSAATRAFSARRSSNSD